jgi:dephospho-CoA kinase
MKWIGLTGGIASGKSSVSQILKDEGFSVVDADAIARLVVDPGSPGLRTVLAQFGNDLLSPDGSLDRKRLGQLVFGQPEQLTKLEHILHPLVRQETAKQKQELEKQGKKFAFYDVPLLFEKKMQPEFDGILVVSTSEDLQKARMKKRDGLSDSEIANRLSAQLKLPDKVKQATWVIENNAGLSELRNSTLEILKKIQSGQA